MEAILLQYAWVLIVLIVLEGLLAADNAVVMAVMVKHLPKNKQQKALLYGLFGAFIFRFCALFLITILVNFWEIQAIGAIYLLFISGKHLYETFGKSEEEQAETQPKKESGFWMTVLKVEVADIAFAIDSILAAIAIAVTLPSITDIHIGGINIGPFVVMLLGGFIGVVMMRFAAKWFVTLLLSRWPQVPGSGPSTAFPCRRPNARILLACGVRRRACCAAHQAWRLASGRW